MVKRKGLVSTIRPCCAYAAAWKAAGKGRGAASRPRRAGAAGTCLAEARDDAAELGTWPGDGVWQLKGHYAGNFLLFSPLEKKLLSAKRMIDESFVAGACGRAGAEEPVWGVGAAGRGGQLPVPAVW